MKPLLLIVLSTLSSTCFAADLVLLPIQQVEINRHDNSELQILVTMKYDTCRYNYRGLYLETASSGQGLVKAYVRALANERATERGSAPCTDAQVKDASLRTDSIKMQSASERLDVIPVQPK